jgi:hypothetical protein
VHARSIRSTVRIFAVGTTRAWSFAAAVLSLTGAASAAPTMREVLTAVYGVHDLAAVDLSPTGEALVWQESFHSARHLFDSPRMNALYLQRLAGGGPIRITAGPPAAYCDEEDPVWSPDGSAVDVVTRRQDAGSPHRSRRIDRELVEHTRRFNHRTRQVVFRRCARDLGGFAFGATPDFQP